MATTRENHTDAGTLPQGAADANDVAELRCQLERERRHREEGERYLQAISEVLGPISRSPSDFQAVAVLCNAAMGAVTRYDGKLVHLVSAHNVSEGKGMEAIFGAFPRAPTDGGAVDDVVRTGSIVNIPDVTAEGAYSFPAQARDIGFRSILAVPMLNNGATLGVVTVYGADAEAFEERHIDLLQSFADQAVIAIEKSRLFEAEQERTRELREALENQTATAEILGVISQSPTDSKPVFAVIAK
jgi:two-component system NtrC family sensor kinase